MRVTFRRKAEPRTSEPSNLDRKLFPKGCRPWKGRSAWQRHGRGGVNGACSEAGWETGGGGGQGQGNCAGGRTEQRWRWGGGADDGDAHGRGGVPLRSEGRRRGGAPHLHGEGVAGEDAVVPVAVQDGREAVRCGLGPDARAGKVTPHQAAAQTHTHKDEAR